MPNRYDIAGTEGQYQPGSDDTVLLNKLGITSSAEMDDIELELLYQLYDKVLSDVSVNQSLVVADIKGWHSSWLGNVYDWAGDERSVNMSKPDMHFATANLVPQLLEKFEQDYLSSSTPCEGFSESALVEALAGVHVEFILIHPFREGNGRISRLLANIMALQAGWPELDFSLLDEQKLFYFKAIQAGSNGDLQYIERLFRDVLQQSLRASE